MLLLGELLLDSCCTSIVFFFLINTHFEKNSCFKNSEEKGINTSSLVGVWSGTESIEIVSRPPEGFVGGLAAAPQEGETGRNYTVRQVNVTACHRYRREGMTSA